MKTDPKVTHLLSRQWIQAGSRFEDPVTGEWWPLDYAYSVQKAREHGKAFDPKKFLNQALR